MPYLSALEVCSRRGAIQIHVYLTLPYSAPAAHHDCRPSTNTLCNVDVRASKNSHKSRRSLLDGVAGTTCLSTLHATATVFPRSSVACRRHAPVLLRTTAPSDCCASLLTYSSPCSTILPVFQFPKFLLKLMLFAIACQKFLSVCFHATNIT